MRRHNPVAAVIDVTDNCFCGVFFAGLYLSSRVNKTALIFHENNEVFVNIEIWRSSCLLIEGNALIKCRRSLKSQISRKYQINGK